MRSLDESRLETIELELAAEPWPDEIGVLLAEADRRAALFDCDKTQAAIPEFVGSNYHVACAALRALAEHRLAPGPRFCEWGSGLGIVTCLASMLGFEATGIEIEPRLVSFAKQFAADFAPAARFVEGSFKPAGLYTETIDESRLDAKLGFSPTDFDIVYAYPWPAEEKSVVRLFESYGNERALLITYHGGGRIKLRRR